MRVSAAGDELLPAACAAEPVCHAIVLNAAARRPTGHDIHATDWVLHGVGVALMCASHGR